MVVTTGAISHAVKLQSNRYHQQTNAKLFTGQMPFLSPNQQCQSTEGKFSIHNMDGKAVKLPKSSFLHDGLHCQICYLCITWHKHTSRGTKHLAPEPVHRVGAWLVKKNLPLSCIITRSPSVVTMPHSTTLCVNRSGIPQNLGLGPYPGVVGQGGHINFPSPQSCKIWTLHHSVWAVY